MKVTINENGDITRIEPKKIYQRSNLASVLYLYAPFAVDTEFVLHFELPNTPVGSLNRDNEMTNITSDIYCYGLWQFALPYAITRFYGNVKYQFVGVDGETQIVTGRGLFKVEKGVGE